MIIALIVLVLGVDKMDWGLISVCFILYKKLHNEFDFVNGYPFTSIFYFNFFRYCPVWKANMTAMKSL